MAYLIVGVSLKAAYLDYYFPLDGLDRSFASDGHCFAVSVYAMNRGRVKPGAGSRNLPAKEAAVTEAHKHRIDDRKKHMSR